MKRIRIGSGHGYWGDIFDPGKKIVEEGDVQYIAYDFLGEPTIPILQQLKRKSPDKGYVPAISQLCRTILGTCLDKGIKIVTNAGAANPIKCGERVQEVAKGMGLKGFKIGVVVNDDIHESLDKYLEQGITFENLDTGEKNIGLIKDKIVGSYVYIGSEPIVEALENGADIVLTPRTTDDAAILAPMIKEFGWGWDQWDLLACGITAAHLIECGGVSTGGVSNLWRDVPEPWNLGYPIADISEKGDFFITKTKGTGGIINKTTITEHLLYEVHDPANYLMPEVVTDFTQIKLEEIGNTRVRVTGSKGKQKPDSLKVGFAYRDGFIGEGETTLTWPDALEKAKRSEEIIRKRFEMVGLKANEIRADYIGYNSVFGAVAEKLKEGHEPLEVRLRVTAKTDTREEAAKVPREMTWLMGGGPIGSSGQLNAPAPREVLALWPSLIPRELVQPKVIMMEV